MCLLGAVETSTHPLASYIYIRRASTIYKIQQQHTYLASCKGEKQKTNTWQMVGSFILLQLVSLFLTLLYALLPAGWYDGDGDIPSSAIIARLSFFLSTYFCLLFLFYFSSTFFSLSPRNKFEFYEKKRPKKQMYI